MPKEINISDSKEIKQKKEFTKEETINTEISQKKQPEEIPPTPTTEEVTKPEEKGSVIQTKEKKERKKIKFKDLIFPIVAVLTLAGIGAFYYFGIFKVKPTPPSDVVPFSENFISSVASLKTYISNLTLLSEPSEPKTEESPINGLLFTKSVMDVLMNRRPVVVMINNHSIAWP